MRLAVLLVGSWVVMTFTHEIGHILGGWCSGGSLESADLVPWHLPYSFFNPDPHPLVTLWSGLLLGVGIPLILAVALGKKWIWFTAYFCMLGNGVYIAVGWFSGEPHLDTTKLIEHGASRLMIALYCCVTIGFGYTGFRRTCIAVSILPRSKLRRQQLGEREL